MVKKIARSVGAVLLSIAVTTFLLAAIEGISAILHPFPADFGGTREEMFAHVANYPAWVIFLLGGPGWMATAAIGTYLATRLGSNRHPAHGYGVGILFLVAAAINIAVLPYPLWYKLMALVALPASSYFGVWLGAGARLQPAAGDEAP